MLSDCTGQAADADSDAVLQAAVARLREDVRGREQACVDALLRLYRFRPDDARMDALPLTDGRWDDDLFNPETLRQMGVRLGTGAAAGAAAGVGIDLMTGGLTLGAAAALGAIAGGLWQTFGHYGERIAAKLRGHRELTVDDAILRIVALRQRELLAALEGRGHAAMTPIEVGGGAASASGSRLPVGEATDPLTRQWRTGSLPAALIRARAHPEWAGADGGALVWSSQMVKDLLAAAFAMAMLGAIESLLCAVVLDGMTGRRHSANSELLGQGIGNLITPFFGGITATAAIARSATNVRSGARSPVAGIIHAITLTATEQRSQAGKERTAEQRNEGPQRGPGRHFGRSISRLFASPPAPANPWPATGAPG